jgi:hypothetical protein
MECHICGVTIGKGCNHYNSVRDNLNAVKESIESRVHFSPDLFKYGMDAKDVGREVLTIDCPVLHSDSINVIKSVCDAMNCTFYLRWTNDAIQCRIIDMRQ